MSFNLTYLACPYTHADSKIRIQRFEASAHAAAYLIHRGMFVYSPITMTHPIDLVMNEEGETMGSDYWCDFDEAFMGVCREMIILTLPGWRDSNGIKREIAYFNTVGRPIRYMSANEEGYELSNSAQKEVST
jgi:hypothetical protein